MKLFFSAIFLLALSSCSTMGERVPSSADAGDGHRACANGVYADTDFCRTSHRY